MKQWTKEDVDLAVTLRKQKIPSSDIAVRLNRTEHAVNCMLSRHRNGKLSRKVTAAPQSLAKDKPVKRGLFRWLFGV